MTPFRWFVERMFDLVWPPEDGDPPVTFRQKVASVVVIIVFAALLAR